VGRRAPVERFSSVQSVYADLYVRDEYWPDVDPQHIEHALAWIRHSEGSAPVDADLPSSVAQHQRFSFTYLALFAARKC
jgi:hypothetical protein